MPQEKKFSWIANISNQNKTKNLKPSFMAFSKSYIQLKNRRTN